MKNEILGEFIDEVIATSYGNRCGRHALRIRNYRDSSVPIGSYFTSYSSGELAMGSSSSLGESFGLMQMIAPVRSGHFADYLGLTQPKYLLRPLWLDAKAEIVISEFASICLPEFMLTKESDLWLKPFCQRLLAYGYNAIIFGERSDIPNKKIRSSKTLQDAQQIFKQLSAFGIQPIIKISLSENAANFLSPFDSQFANLVNTAIDQLLEGSSNIKGIFWDSLYQHKHFRQTCQSKEVLELEGVVAEMQIVEKAISQRCQLLFFLSSNNINIAQRQTEWMSHLLDEIHTQTTLVFNAVAGRMHEDYMPDHPYWKRLRHEVDCSASALMPIVNVGLVGQGEGLWPICNIDLLERFLPRCQRHHFKGVIGLTPHIPQEGSFLDAMLWVAGQALWRDMPPHLLAETWFSAYRSNEDYPQIWSLLQKARSMQLQLAEVLTLTCMEKCRRQGEVLPYFLQQIENLSEKLPSNLDSPHPTIKDQFIHFSCDIRRILERGLQFSPKHLGIKNSREDLESGFWTQPSGRGELLDMPRHGPPGSTMESITNFNDFLLYSPCKKIPSFHIV